MKPRVLCLVVDGVEELELVAPVDVLRRAEVEVVLAAVGHARRVTGRCGVVLEADGVVASELALPEAATVTPTPWSRVRYSTTGAET